MKKTQAIAVFLLLAAGCSSTPRDAVEAPPMDPTRKVSEKECNRSFENDGGNLMCREITEEERRARIAEEERQARAKKEAAERAERDRLERERAEALAREEAARKARAAEEERLAAERRRLEEEAARKAQEERERKEKAEAEARARKEKEEAEARARAQAEKEAREAAAAECRRVEQERRDARTLLEDFVSNYGKDPEFKGIAAQIAAFLKKPRKERVCPEA